MVEKLNLESSDKPWVRTDFYSLLKARPVLVMADHINSSRLRLEHMVFGESNHGANNLLDSILWQTTRDDTVAKSSAHQMSGDRYFSIDFPLFSKLDI